MIYEYKVEKLDRGIDPGTMKELEFLSAHSKAGWEHYFTYIGVMLYYFKRPLKQQP